MGRIGQRLEEYLRENGAEFEVIPHPTAYTMPEVAAALHIPGRRVAKVVMVNVDERPCMFVIASPDRLDLKKVRDALGAREVRLAKEHEFAALFADSMTGAMPPFGNLYNVPVYVDETLAAQPEIVFRAGTHSRTIRMRYADFARLVQPTVGDFAVRF